MLVYLAPAAPAPADPYAQQQPPQGYGAPPQQGKHWASSLDMELLTYSSAMF